GILKQGVPAVSAGQGQEAAAVLEFRAREMEIPLWRPGRDYRFESRTDRDFCYQGPSGFCVRPRGPLALLGSYQRANAALCRASLLRRLVPLARTSHFGSVNSPRAADPRALAAASGRTDAQVHPSTAAALEAGRAAAGREGVVLCCGSLYLAGEVGAALAKRAPAFMPSERL